MEENRTVYMASFVIIGTPRTGTTMLVNTLNNAQDFTVLGEVCTPKIGMNINQIHWDKVVQKQREQRIKYHITTWMKENKYDKIDKNVVFKYFDYVYSLNKHVGYKLLYPHMQKIPYAVEYIKEKNIKCIHLFREKKLKQAVSLQKRKIDKWSGKFTANINSLKNTVQSLNKQEKWIETEFKYCTYMRLSYETLTNDEYIDVLPGVVQRAIFDFLNIKENKDVPLEVFTKRNAPSKLKDRLKNYNEVINEI